MDLEPEAREGRPDSLALLGAQGRWERQGLTVTVVRRDLTE